MFYLILIVFIILYAIYYFNKTKYPTLISNRANNDNFMFLAMSDLLFKTNKTPDDIKKFKNEADDNIDVLINNRASCLKCPGYENVKFQQFSNSKKPPVLAKQNTLDCKIVEHLTDNVTCDQLEGYRNERKKENIDHTNLLFYKLNS